MNLTQRLETMDPHARVMVARRPTLRFATAGSLADIVALETEIERLAEMAESRERESVTRGIVAGRDDATSTEMVRAIQRAPMSKIERVLMQMVVGL